MKIENVRVGNLRAFYFLLATTVGPRVAEWFVPAALFHKCLGSNPAGGAWAVFIFSFFSFFCSGYSSFPPTRHRLAIKIGCPGDKVGCASDWSALGQMVDKPTLFLLLDNQYCPGLLSFVWFSCYVRVSCKSHPIRIFCCM